MTDYYASSDFFESILHLLLKTDHLESMMALINLEPIIMSQALATLILVEATLTFITLKAISKEAVATFDSQEAFATGALAASFFRLLAKPLLFLLPH